jgi:hypothetical protein
MGLNPGPNCLSCGTVLFLLITGTNSRLTALEKRIALLNALLQTVWSCCQYVDNAVKFIFNYLHVQEHLSGCNLMLITSSDHCCPAKLSNIFSSTIVTLLPTRTNYRSLTVSIRLWLLLWTVIPGLIRENLLRTSYEISVVLQTNANKRRQKSDGI